MNRIDGKSGDNSYRHEACLVPGLRRLFRWQIAFVCWGLVAAAFLPVLFGWSAAPSAVAAQASSRLTATDFTKLMEKVSAGWNEGNARMAAECFSEDAQYSAPPSRPRIGRQSLFDYFGGSKGRELPMHMQWHHLVFDSTHQIGMGEYTFKYRIQSHGVVVVKVENGLIKNWREYEVESELPWDEFVGTNRF